MAAYCATASFDAPDIETSSEGYARRFAGPVGEFFLDVQTNAILELLSPWPRATVLDVGGGHGQSAVPLVRAGFEVTVIGSADACRARLDQLLPPDSYCFIQGDLLDLPLADCSFDVVLALRLLAHVPHWPKLVEELCRVARRAVIVDYADLRSVNFVAGALFKAKKSVEGNTRPFICHWRRQITDELKRSGFSSDKVWPQFFFPMAIHRSLGKAAVSRSMERVARWAGLTHWLGSPVILRATRTVAPHE